MNMLKKMPSYEDCLEIVKNNDSFTHRIREVNGFKISIFDYLMANYSDFKNPIKGSDLDAFELRGLCFTHNLDNSIHKRYCLLHKFFNLNQCQTYQYDDLKKYEIKTIMSKLDGSVIRFIRLPNGEIVAKSKTFFGNDQTIMAESIISTDIKLRSFIEESLNMNLCAIFELTSPKNRIVVPYLTNKLTLIQLRDEETGDYLDIHNNSLVQKYHIETVTQPPSLTLDELIIKQKEIENEEGWVVTFSNNQIVKIKTEWYCNLHGLLTEFLSKENEIMKMIVNNTVDDALAKMDLTDYRKPQIEELVVRTQRYVLERLNMVKGLIGLFKGDKKEWAIENLKNQNFPIASKIINYPNYDDEMIIALIINEIGKQNQRLEQSRSWIKENLHFELGINTISE